MTVDISWPRRFRLWHYSVSYTQLLMRSLDAERDPRRIDILFSNVEWMQVAALYETMAIEELISPDPRWSEMPLRRPSNEKRKVFLLNGGPDLVIATHCQWHEDDGDAHTPSRFGPLRRTD